MKEKIKKQPKDNNADLLPMLIDDLKLYLQSRGWETSHAEVVVDVIINTFKEGVLINAAYDEIARNSGVGTPPPFDKKAITQLNQIKSLLLEK